MGCQHAQTLTQPILHYGQFGNANQPTLHGFGLWEETRSTLRKPTMHLKKTQESTRTPEVRFGGDSVIV